MKIENSPSPLASVKTTVPSRTANGAANSAANVYQAQAEPTSKATQPSAVVNTSATASLQQAAQSEPSFNSQKVAEIRKAIAEGKFQINPEKIADGLIGSVRDMLAQGRKAA
ncbi:MAG TPA: flagellar biosynthesis anti-sigma factor FlgM [Rhodocyclaceae bacterium]|nr:flagellar biosynthesis anti-sigma factor FlgM [Rhodocyclaceae bacterium]